MNPSKHDDAADMVSMLIDIEAYKPSAPVVAEYVENEEGTFAFYQSEDEYNNSGGSTIF